MREKQSWQQFVQSGKVADYLNYRACVRAEGAEASQEETGRIQGVKENAGWHFDDRTDTESGACRGI